MAKAFGRQRKDDNGFPINVANAIITQDITGTPQKSPLTVSDTIIKIAIPTNAVVMVCYAVTQAIRVSEQLDLAAYQVMATTHLPLRIPCAETDNLYFVRNGGSDGTLNFLFELI